MLPNVGWSELLIVLVIVLVLFGAKRLPELAKSMGSSLHAFKKGIKDGFEPNEKDAKETKEEAKLS
jgi:sec-independent protein translocase protein TatA